MNRKNWLLSTLIAVSLVSATLQGVFYWFGLEEQPQTAQISVYIYVYMIAMWVVVDSKSYKKIDKPYDYGFIVYFF